MADEIAKGEQQGMMERPSHIPKSDEGTTHIGRNDIKLPRLALAQALSPQVIEGNENYMPALKPGNFFNDISGEIYGRGPIQFAIVRGDVPKYIEFAPRDEGGGVVDMNVAAGDPRTQFTKDSSGKTVKPIATKIYDYVLLMFLRDRKPPKVDMVTFSMASSALKMAQKLNAMIMAREAAIYAGVYELTTVQKTGAKGTYWTPIIKNAGWLDEQTLHVAQSAHEKLKELKLDIVRSAGEDDFDPDELEK